MIDVAFNLGVVWGSFHPTHVCHIYMTRTVRIHNGLQAQLSMRSVCMCSEGYCSPLSTQHVEIKRLDSL